MMIIIIVIIIIIIIIIIMRRRRRRRRRRCKCICCSYLFISGNFYFSLMFLGMVMYPIEAETKEK